MKRREFLTKSAAGIGSILLGGKIVSSMQSAPKFFDPRENVPLGKTGIKYSRISFGTGTKGWDQKSNQVRLGKENFESLIRYAYENGVRAFDLADLYGTHPYIVRALKKIPRKNYQITTKIWFKPGGLLTDERPDADVLIPQFLKEINTDYIDLVQLHCVTKPDWPNRLEKQMNILAKLKKKGLIRAHGITAHSFAALETAAEQSWVDAAHVRINPFGAKTDGPPEKLLPILEKLHAKGKGILGMKLIGQGDFADSPEKIDKSINYALNVGAVDCMVVGFLNPAEIDDFAVRIKKVPKTLV